MINKIIKMTMFHYGGTSRDKRNWVREEEMLFFNAISIDKHMEGHIIELRLTC